MAASLLRFDLQARNGDADILPCIQSIAHLFGLPTLHSILYYQRAILQGLSVTPNQVFVTIEAHQPVFAQ